MEGIVVTDMWSSYILVMGRKWSKLCVKHFRVSVDLDSGKTVLFKHTTHLKLRGVAQNMHQNKTPWEKNGDRRKKEEREQKKERKREKEQEWEKGEHHWKKNNEKFQIKIKEREKALTEVNLKNSWTFFQGKN